eukprot:351599-Chlamydomonas_euryale.AAC.5
MASVSPPLFTCTFTSCTSTRAWYECARSHVCGDPFPSWPAQLEMRKANARQVARMHADEAVAVAREKVDRMEQRAVSVGEQLSGSQE